MAKPSKKPGRKPAARPKAAARKTTVPASKVAGRKPEPRRSGSKISATLGVMLAQFPAGRKKAVVKPVRAMAAGALGAAAAGRPTSRQVPKVPLMVRLNQKAKADIEGLCGSGRVRTAWVPMSRIAELAARGDIERLSAPRQLKPLLDVALPLVRVPAFRAKPATASSGRGVIVGVVDSGIDATHPDFAGRILKIWDHHLLGDGAGSEYSTGGRVLTGPQWNASVDTSGHGTHVAGIAAGAGVTYQGVAPAAELLVVKTTFYTNSVYEGVRWIFDEAERLGRPAVVNLSLGGHGDGHDGSDDLSVGLAELCGPGRLVVAAAGNESSDNIHAWSAIAGTQPVAFPVEVAPKSSGLPLEWFALNGWYEGAGACQIRLVGPTGAVTPWQGLLGTDPPAAVYPVGADQATLSSPDGFAGKGDRQFFVEVAGGTGRVQGGRWTLEVRRAGGSPGNLHVWLLYGQEASRRAIGFGAGAATVFELIGSPGAAGPAVTVAAYTSRNEWNDIRGVRQQVGLPVNEISDFSSPGLLRGGGLKPDVTAPGAMLVSCESSGSQNDPSERVAAGYVVNAGTSMACPFITGVLALRLERDPTLTPARAKAFLKKRSRIPGQPVRTHDPKWGYGLLRL